MTIIEPRRYEPEEILRIPTPVGSQRCYVISGFADFSWGENRFGGPLGMGPQGSDRDDETWVSHNVHLVVGAEYLEVFDVSPTVAVAGFHFRDSDETDDTGIELENCRWDTVGVGEPNTSKERIRLKIKLRMCGGTNSVVSKISYHLVALVSEASAFG